MRIFVTGCAGYIGSQLCEILTQRPDYEVVGLDNFRYGNQSAIHGLLGRPNFRFIRGCATRDIHRYGFELRRANAVIPLAGIVGAPACDDDPDEAWRINHDQITEVAWLLRDCNGTRIILPNTNSGYGTTDGSREVTEVDALTPITTYGTSKCAGEADALKHSNTVVFRLATVFGTSPRMRFDLMVNDFFRKLYYKRALGIFEPHYNRNFVHIRDVCRAFIHALNPSFPRGVYNLGLPTTNLSKYQLAASVCGYLGLDPGKVVTVQLGCDPDQRNYLVSNAKVLATGFKFNYELQDGFRELRALCDIHAEDDLKQMGNV